MFSESTEVAHWLKMDYKNDSTIQNGRDQKESYGENKSCYGVMQKYKIDSAICL